MSYVLQSTRTLQRVIFLTTIGVTTLSTACRRAKADTAAAPTTTGGVSSTPETSGGTEAPTTPAEQPAPRESESENRARRRAVLEQVVYFQFDQSELSATARALLDEKLIVLRSEPRISVRIEGHADERGSDEYNIALAMRRATAVKRYLTERGIAADRLDTVSYGEERPLCPSSGDDCWSKNRRAEFTVQGWS